MASSIAVRLALGVAGRDHEEVRVATRRRACRARPRRAPSCRARRERCGAPAPPSEARSRPPRSPVEPLALDPVRHTLRDQEPVRPPAATRSRTSVEDTSIRGIENVVTRASPPSLPATSPRLPAERRRARRPQARASCSTRSGSCQLARRSAWSAPSTNTYSRLGARRRSCSSVSTCTTARGGRPRPATRSASRLPRPPASHSSKRSSGPGSLLDRPVRRLAHAASAAPRPAPAASTPPARTPGARCAAG